MKKLLTVLGVIPLTITASTSVIACKKEEPRSTTPSSDAPVTTKH